MENRNHLNEKSYMNQLADFALREYGISAVSITPAKRGYYGETWRLETRDSLYFVKLNKFPRHQMKFQNSLQIVEYLCNNGIDFIGKIIKTCNNELYTIYNSAILAVFEWIDGENIQTDDTKILEYQMLCKIYALTKQGFNIPTVNFSDDTAIRFYEKWKKLKVAPLNETSNAICSIFEQHGEKLSHCALRLSHFALLCQTDKSDFFITHGDAGGNFLKGNGRYYIVDWDEVMYAPLERDAYVMCCFDWAVKLFNDTLRQNNIQYKLRPELLAFYCYHMLFFYLCEFIDDFTLYKIEDYLSWIDERIKFADKIKT